MVNKFILSQSYADLLVPSWQVVGERFSDKELWTPWSLATAAIIRRESSAHNKMVTCKEKINKKYDFMRKIVPHVTYNTSQEYTDGLWCAMVVLPISFRVVALALGQLCDCPSASEATLKNMGKQTKSARNTWYNQNKTRHKNCIYLFH